MTSSGKINIKPSNKGKLHQNLGIPKSKPIPTAKLASAKKTASPTVKKQITFAQNSRKWHSPK